MRAIVQREYGAPQDVLDLAEVSMPTAGAEDVLVLVRASSANSWDWHFIRGEPVLLRPTGLGGVRKPRFPVPGGDLAGTVAQTGSSVTAFKLGDEVYGFGHGAFAEYIAVPQGSLAPRPRNLTFEQATAVPLAAVTALQVPARSRDPARPARPHHSAPRAAWGPSRCNSPGTSEPR